MALKIVPSPPIEISKSKDLSRSLNELMDFEIKPLIELKYSDSIKTETFFFYNNVIKLVMYSVGSDLLILPRIATFI